MAAERPHTRLWVSDGVLHQKLLYTDALVVNDADCVIFNDGQRTSGCARDEFKAFVSSAGRAVCARTRVCMRVRVRVCVTHRD